MCLRMRVAAPVQALIVFNLNLYPLKSGTQT